MRLLLAMLALSASCANTGAHERLDQLETSNRTSDQQLDSLDERIEAFEHEVDEVLALYSRASTAFQDAKQQYDHARSASDQAAVSFEQARRDYEAAERNWRLVTIALLSAAAWDYAGHLCDTRMTTSEYRRELKSQGIDLDGLDADHGLPRSQGGADHPLNYEMIDSGLNRSLGNDLVRKLMEHPAHLLQGATISAMMRLRCSPQL